MNHTPEQRSAITSNNPITFCIAGAGSGKTTCLIGRVVHLVEDRDVEPSAICALTFTNAAALEMQKRLDALGIRIGFIGTLHSFMLRLLRIHHALVGYRPDINVLDEEESETFRDKVVSDLKYNGTKSALIAAIALGPPTATERLSKERLVAAHYYKQLKSANLMTFDSILVYGLKVCQALKTATQIANAHPFTHYLIDEVQDSSALDFKIFGAFVGDRFFAGDDSQSIYSFRGGDVTQCLNLAKVAKVYPLEDNFRCGSVICDAAQRLIEHNKCRYPKVTRSATGFPGKIALNVYQDAATEAAGISALIATSDVPHDDIAVLFRNNALVAEYSNHLRAVGIPIAERVFKERPADFGKLRLLLAFLNNPNDDYVSEKWLRCLNPDGADKIISEAKSKFKVLNQLVFDVAPPVPLNNVAHYMNCAKLSASTVSIVESSISKLPDGSTIGDLILSIRSHGDGEEVGSGVTVSTIHGAKGREWSAVFLPAFEQETIPGERKAMDLEEERRIAYVAITRAKHSLVLSRSLFRISYEDRARLKRQPNYRCVPQPTTPSQFIDEALPPMSGC